MEAECPKDDSEARKDVRSGKSHRLLAFRICHFRAGCRPVRFLARRLPLAPLYGDWSSKTNENPSSIWDTRRNTRETRIQELVQYYLRKYL